MGTRERRKKTRSQQKIAKYRNKQRLILERKRQEELEALEKELDKEVANNV